ncbi:DUF2865 domain-containing protein [Roseibium sp. FZY0029]|uniref:DUF2865 domain-containing protein n=1 Tax=Roseibium sp. FZY0029 TaxID=3116647 RepID=UPI002EC21ACE|nr:DUF2865 domain-containing protein [Roseibium sp. FZY0029]
MARAVAFGAGLVLSANTASAATCSSLKAELQRLEQRSGVQSPAAQKWSTAKSQQQKAISAAERDASYFGCGSTASDKCNGLNDKIKRMKANLAAIDRQLAKSGGGSSKNAKRVRQIRASLGKQNCNAPSRDARQHNTDGENKPQSLLARIFSPQQRVEQQSVEQPRVERTSATTGDREIASVRRQIGSESKRYSLPSGGAFRTVCVRTCDGYFFPVSFSTGKNHFAYDEARCSEICPAAETELYVYRNPGGDQSQMMSLAGQLYSEQPFAYRYKSEFVEGCSCRATRQSKAQSAWTELSSNSGNRVFFTDISAGLPRKTLQPSRGGTYEHEEDLPSPLARTPLDRTQLPRFEDPDTLMNMEKGFDVSARLDLAATRLESGDNEVASSSGFKDGFPVLSIRSREKADEEDLTAFSPVFKADDDGYREAPDRKAPVRVVGPEYFVAQ